MKARLMFAALLAAALMADGAARASAVRTGAMGGVEAIVEDESNSISLH